MSLEHFPDISKVLDASGEPGKLGDHDKIGFASMNSTKQSLKLRAIRVLTRARVDIDVRDFPEIALPVSGPDGLPETLFLIPDRTFRVLSLLLGADPDVA